MCIAVNKRTSTFDVYIGRPSIFGNPFIIGRDGTRDEVIEKYRVWFHSNEGTAARAAARQIVKGSRLGCFCKPAACHGDVIAAYINSL